MNQFTIRVTWTDLSGAATGFNIDNGCPTGACDPGATLEMTTGPTTAADFTVTPGSYQCFRVQAVNGSATSDWSGYGCTSTPGFVLRGTRGWVDTGVDLPAGIRFGFKADGAMDVDSGRRVGPSGDPSCVPASTHPSANPPFIASNLHCWALIARIGAAAPFEVGARLTDITGNSGRLYLCINGDAYGTYPGSWTVSMKKGGEA